MTSLIYRKVGEVLMAKYSWGVYIQDIMHFLKSWVCIAILIVLSVCCITNFHILEEVFESWSLIIQILNNECKREHLLSVKSDSSESDIWLPSWGSSRFWVSSAALRVCSLFSLPVTEEGRFLDGSWATPARQIKKQTGLRCFPQLLSFRLTFHTVSDSVKLTEIHFFLSLWKVVTMTVCCSSKVVSPPCTLSRWFFKRLNMVVL
jgi:hypothetical protein